MDSVKDLPISTALPDTIFSTPEGIPARFPSSASAIAVRGVSSEGFKHTVHPAARAGETFLVIMLNGKFHGVMAPTTPIGCFMTKNCLSFAGVSTISPQTRFASSANQVIDSIPESNSFRDSGRGFPHSMVIIIAISSFACRISSCHRRRIEALSFAVRDAHGLKASAAALMAFSVSW